MVECATATPADGRRGDRTYAVWASRLALSHDFTVLTIIDANTGSGVPDRYNGVDYSLQRQRIKAAW